MEEIVKEFLSIQEQSKMEEYYWTEIVCTNRMKEFHLHVKMFFAKEDKVKQRYYYLITFTLNDDNKDIDPNIVSKYIISRLASSALQIEKAHLVQELTEQGRPHWHASVLAKKYISKDRFKYYVNKFGFVDISKNHSQNYETMLKYINKSNVSRQIIGGL